MQDQEDIRYFYVYFLQEFRSGYYLKNELEDLFMIERNWEYTDWEGGKPTKLGPQGPRSGGCIAAAFGRAWRNILRELNNESRRCHGICFKFARKGGGKRRTTASGARFSIDMIEMRKTSQQLLDDVRPQLLQNLTQEVDEGIALQDHMKHCRDPEGLMETHKRFTNAKNDLKVAQATGRSAPITSDDEEENSFRAEFEDLKNRYKRLEENSIMQETQWVAKYSKKQEEVEAVSKALREKTTKSNRNADRTMMSSVDNRREGEAGILQSHVDGPDLQRDGGENLVSMNCLSF